MNSIISEDVKNILANDLDWERFRGKTVLITGASGMIPSYILYTFLMMNDMKDLGVKVLALVRNREKAERILRSVLDRDDIDLIVQDVCDPVNYDGPVDYIFHGGSAARPAAHKSSPTSTIKANLLGTFNLLELARDKGSEGFVLMSSSEVYGKTDDDSKAITENDYGALDILDTRSCYSEGKRAAETISSCYNAEFGIKVTAARFAHIYGPGLALDDGRVQADFAANVMRDEDIVMNSDGSSVRAYTYVADAVAGVFFALIKGDEIAYNIADSDGIVSIRELAEAFVGSRPEKGLKVQCRITNDTGRSYSPVKFTGLDSSRLKSLGWEPHVHVKEGCARMISYYEEVEKAEADR